MAPRSDFCYHPSNTRIVPALHSAIDAWINCAGIISGNEELEPDERRRVIDVNRIGLYLICRAVVPQMLKQGYGRIGNIASVAGKEGNQNALHYSASKAGVIGLTKSLGKKLATMNVLVNAVTLAAVKPKSSTRCRKKYIDYMLSKIPMNRFQAGTAKIIQVF